MKTAEAAEIQPALCTSSCCELCGIKTTVLCTFYLQRVCDECHKRLCEIARKEHTNEWRDLIFYIRALVYHIRKAKPQEHFFEFLYLRPLPSLNYLAALMTHAVKLIA